MNAEGATKRLADTMRDTTIGKFRELKSVIESVGIDTFNSKQGKLNELIESSTKFFRENKDEIIDVAGGVGELVIGMARLTGLLTTLTGKGTSYWATFNQGLAAAQMGLISFNDVLESTQKELEEKLAGDQVVMKWDMQLKELGKKLDTFAKERRGETGSFWTDLLTWRGQDEATLQASYDRILKYKQEYLLNKERAQQKEANQQIEDDLDFFLKEETEIRLKEKTDRVKREAEIAAQALDEEKAQIKQFIKELNDLYKLGERKESMWSTIGVEEAAFIDQFIKDSETIESTSKQMFDGIKEGGTSAWAEAIRASQNFAAQGKQLTNQFRSDWSSAISDTVDLYIQGENDKINIQAAAGEVMTNAAGNFAKQQFDKILPRLIEQIAVSLGMGAAFSASKGAQEGGWKGALKDIGLFLGTGVASMLAGRALASKFYASGGNVPWNFRNPNGGYVNEGSFKRDDVYFGSTQSANHFIKGGEFVVNPIATARNLQLLTAMNRTNMQMFSGGHIPNTYHASGGDIDTSKLSLQGNTSGWKGLAESVNIGGFATFMKEWAKDKNPYSAIGKAIAYYAATFGGGFSAKAMGNKFAANGMLIENHSLGDYIKKMANPTRRWNPKTLWEDTLDSWSYPIENAVKDLLTPGVNSHSLKLTIPEFATGTGLDGLSQDQLLLGHQGEIILNAKQSKEYRKNSTLNGSIDDTGIKVIFSNYGTISSARDENELFKRMTDKIKSEIRGML
jgi:hypothetical protein